MSTPSTSENLKIEKGHIFAYRVFDVGDEINLKLAAAILERNSSPHRFRLKKRFSNVIIKDAPLVVSLGGQEFQILGHSFDVEIQAKLWRFGAVSINFQMKIPKGLTFDSLTEIAKYLDDDSEIHLMATQKVGELMTQLQSVIQNHKLWESSEDYITYCINSFTDSDISPRTLIDNDDAASLILAEDKANLSDQIRTSIRSAYYQFGPRDLVLIDWNSALVIDPSEEMDIPDVLEFALCQLLELRFYDDLLDEKLSELYNAIEKQSGGIFDNRYSKYSQMACQKYIEISEIVENVENSLKVVGDFYLAKTFRLASEKFRFQDWQSNVDKKLNNMAEVSKLLDSKVNEKRGQVMELTIIVLIALEIIPLVRSVVLYFIN